MLIAAHGSANVAVPGLPVLGIIVIVVVVVIVAMRRDKGN
jgi:hypothetical protein